AQGLINHRINILYFLNPLCETLLPAKSHTQADPPTSAASIAQPKNSFYMTSSHKTSNKSSSESYCRGGKACGI
ncbi:hypothetical protein BV22DRAFT_850919, partial [Leucogyrophana mollusca]